MIGFQLSETGLEKENKRSLLEELLRTPQCWTELHQRGGQKQRGVVSFPGAKRNKAKNWFSGRLQKKYRRVVSNAR